MLAPTEAVALAALIAAAIAVITAVRAFGRARDALVERDDAIAAAARPRPVPATEAPFNELLAAVHEPVVIHGERILFVNERFAALLGRTPAELVGQQLSELVAPDYAELVADNVRRRLAGEPAAGVYEIEVTDTAGRLSRLEVGSTPIRYRGAPAVVLTAIEMIAAPNHADPGRSRARATLESLGDGLVTTDVEGRIDYLNRRAEELLGHTLAEVDGRPFADVVNVVDEADRKALVDPVRQCLASGAAVSIGRRAVLLTSVDGSEHSIELAAAPLLGADGAPSGAVVLLHDVTELRGIARQMSYQASHDALTGLVNRREFERRLQDSLDLARAGAQTHVLCYLDLDRFKAVNDTSGHLAGDNMLREVAGVLKDAVRDSDTVARIGGDEFAMLLVGCPLEKAIQIAEDVSTAIRDFRFVWKDKIFTVGVSIGLVEIGRETTSAEDVMSAADSACYVAKNQQEGRVHVYSVRDEAMARVRADKKREAGDGHDGTWVAHPDLVPVAMEVFNRLMPGPNQLGVLRAEVNVTAKDLLEVHEGGRSEAGLRENIRVGVQYIEAWLRGRGAVPLYNLMEDAATAEISRAQVWQWLHLKAKLDDGRVVTPDLFRATLADEMDKVGAALGDAAYRGGRFPEAIHLFAEMSLSPTFEEFLTLPAYRLID